MLAVAVSTAVIAGTATATATAQDPTYKEPFRPQLHFTPAKNWMNDPNGMVYYDGEYHLFFQHNPFENQWGHMSWGHAVSTDLVHWKELDVAIKADEVPNDGKPDEQIFSGSAVVDRLNTSGFGTVANPPMVAIYTSAVPDDQYQSLAYSTDHGRSWTKHGKVLDDPDREFRDPKVFWYAAEQKWVMVAVKAVQHKVAIYESRNLKDWKHLSDFGPANATSGVWECPDLFPLEVDGDPTKSKWVMVVSLNPGGIAGGSGTQYFVGDFDGSKFTADNVKDYTPPTGDVYEDFESSAYSPWTTTGNAFGDQPASGNVPPQGGVSGYEGDKLANSFHEEDRGTGTLTSPPFTITRPALNFLVGGGNHPHDPAAGDGTPPPGDVLADFEGPDYGSWTATGDFAGTTPHRGGDGRVGEQIVDTFFGNPNNGDPNTGSIVSPEFTINRDFLDFEIAGGNHPEPGPGQTAVNLVVDGAIARTATGSDSGTLNWVAWDLRGLRGKQGHVEIVDRATGGWGHVLADHFVLSDVAAKIRSDETAVNLLVDDEVVRTATGKDSEHLDWTGWNVQSLIGKTARLQLVDRSTGGWGHILADQFMFADTTAQSAEQRADWLDYGKDYYAAVSWNDVPNGRRLMIGWANNWQYAGQIPTSPWRSAMSVPRELALKTIDGKVQVVQQPVEELESLRTGRPYHVADEPIVDSARTVERCSGKALEIVAELAVGDARQTGLIVRAGDGQETVVGYDADTEELYVDRTRSGKVDFNPNFPGVQRAPLKPRNGKVRLHVLVDWSLIEVYADQGQRVITDQVFPADSSQGLKVFAAGGSARLESMDVWTPRSIWNGESDAGQCAPRAEQANENPGGAPHPGPNAGNGTKRVFGRVASARASTRCFYDAVLTRGARAARRSMRFTYRLTAAAPVRLTLRRRNGSPAWTSCPARRGKKPYPYTDVDTWNEDGRAGENRTDVGTAARTARARKVVVTRKRPHVRGTVSLKSMLRGKHLRAGTYVLAVASLDDTGRVTSERHVKFWVVRPRTAR